MDQLNPIDPTTVELKPKSVWFDKKHVITYIIVLVGITVIGGAIYGYSKQTKNQKTISGETLAGADTNNNGIRDDIDKYIASTYPNDARKSEALKQLAKTELAYVLANGSDKSAGLSTQIRSDNDCLEYVSGATVGAQEAANLKVQILNTQERIKAYAASEKTAGGGAYFLTAESKLKLGCKFDPDATTLSVDTSTWKTYTNSQYQFEIKLPNNWTNKQSTQNGKTVYSFEDGKDNFSILTIVVPLGPSFKPTTKSEGKLVNFSGVATTFYQDSANGGFVDIYVIQKTDVNNVGITATYPTESKILMDQILSTFKFTNKTSGLNSDLLPLDNKYSWTQPIATATHYDYHDSNAQVSELTLNGYAVETNTSQDNIKSIEASYDMKLKNLGWQKDPNIVQGGIQFTDQIVYSKNGKHIVFNFYSRQLTYKLTIFSD